MEKICIVKRRQQYLQLRNNQALQCVSSEPPMQADPRKNISTHKDNIVEEFNKKYRQEISITMTQEQSIILQESAYIKNILNGSSENIVFRINRENDGRMILTFHLNEFLVRMLRSDQVSGMLQISRSFLARLTRENRIRSYKIGRLRRFLLDDILEYLTNNYGFSKLR